MKLLLTSGGITNDSIAEALVKLVGKPASEAKVALIPTAANVESYNKGWFVNQCINLWRRGFWWIDIVDPSAAGTDWQNRLREVDIIFVSGGNTFHLLDQTRKTGFDTWLKENLGNKVYVGSSAGSILATVNIAAAGIEPGPDPNLPGLTDLTALGFANFELEPHSTDERFKIVEAYAKGKPHPVYAIDDETAIQVVDDMVTVISEGNWRVFQV